MATQITGDSPQAVAYRLLEAIALHENKHIDVEDSGADRAYILDTYKECLTAVLFIRRWGAGGP
jgi:hypothetical protein